MVDAYASGMNFGVTILVAVVVILMVGSMLFARRGKH